MPLAGWIRSSRPWARTIFSASGLKPMILIGPPPSTLCPARLATALALPPSACALLTPPASRRFKITVARGRPPLFLTARFHRGLRVRVSPFFVCLAASSSCPPVGMQEFPSSAADGRGECLGLSPVRPAKDLVFLLLRHCRAARCPRPLPYVCAWLTPAGIPAV